MRRTVRRNKGITDMNETIKIGKCLIDECCGHLYPHRVLKSREELGPCEEIYEAFEQTRLGALEGLEGMIVEIEVKVIGHINDLYN